ncbi:MAG: four-carbon acid sugar kinase family protein [Candidatus Wallacebacter cryptica]|nr:four-carbon acid sugar kinase family protein [Bacillota bacterium]
MSFIGVIADDLTGAMDAGMQMLTANLTVHTALLPQNLNQVRAGADVVVVNTQSRNIEPDAAYRAVKTAFQNLQSAGCAGFYKKIDSTLRGNVGAELRAALDSALFDMILVAPALPFNKRTTRNGIHYVDGVPLAETELAQDPFAPIQDSEISRIIRTQYETDTGLVALDDVHRGAERVSQVMEEYAKAGIKLIIADAAAEQDLEVLAEAAGRLNRSVLLCGSAGLFQYFNRFYGEDLIRTETQIKNQGLNGNGPVLVLSGSPAAASKRQIDRLRDHPDVCVIQLDITRLAEKQDAAARETAQKAVQSLRGGRHVILDAAGTSKAEIYRRAAGDRELLDRHSAMVLNLISETAGAAALLPLAGLVIFGGDTAVAAAGRLGAAGIAIIGEVEPFIPLGRLIGGSRSGLPVVTKAGGFGSDELLIRVLSILAGG